MKAIFVLLLAVTACTNDYIGKEYVGKKYMSDPLGEEQLPDTDPLIRFDAFDCVTFVETSLADGKLEKLNKIRYKNANPNFLNRNHFIETDWLKNNSDLVTNVSNKYGKTDLRHVVINKKEWFKKVHNLETNFDTEAVDLEYIPYKNLTEINNQKPLIVLFIAGNSKKNDKIGTDLAVVHMGFLLPGGILRHASSEHGKVVDVNFKEYAAKRAKNKNNLGVALVEIK